MSSSKKRKAPVAAAVLEEPEVTTPLCSEPLTQTTTPSIEVSTESLQPEPTMSTETIEIEAPVCAEAPAAPATPVESNEAKALKLTRKYALWSMGSGLIPIIGVDIAAIIGVQLKMICELSKLYGVEFKENRAKSIVTTLIGSLGIVPVGTGILFSVMKIIPVVGQLAATVALPVSAGAVTYATGKIFISHFESGGNLMDLNPSKLKEAYRRMFEEGKTVMLQARKEKTA